MIESAAIFDALMERRGRSAEWLARAGIARARETALKAIGRDAFIRAGGTPAIFDDLWPDVSDSIFGAEDRPPSLR
jgi:hypothetical protein